MRRLAALTALLLPLAALAQQPAAPKPAPTPQPAAPGGAWLPRPIAELQALDKISARDQPLSVRVGASATFGSLTIAVRSCVVRPPDQPADAAAFLDITDAHAAAPAFHAWMVASMPSLSILEHPVYDIRLSGCHT